MRRPRWPGWAGAPGRPATRPRRRRRCGRRWRSSGGSGRPRPPTWRPNSTRYWRKGNGSAEQGREQVAVPGHPVQDRLGGEEQVLRTPAGPHFVPADRRRDRGARPGAQRVRRDGGLGPVVLAPVDEDLAGPQRLGHARDDPAWLIAFKTFGERPGLLAGLFG